MRRMLIYDRLGNGLGELSQNDMIACVRREEINGEHSLELSTTQMLEKGQRIVYQDGRGIWREYVVVGVDEEHRAGTKLIGTYYCVWSIQPDLQGVTVSVMPGVQSAVSANAALTSMLSAQSRWAVGTVTNTNTGGASMYDMSAWSAAGVLVGTWKGELSTHLDVSALEGVTARYVDYYAQMGEDDATRRFDFGYDLRSIKRIQDDSPYYCRISPRGKGEETDAGGYGRKITIESVNSGNEYLEYAPMVDVAKLPNGSGGYQYPTLIVENGDCETPAELMAWAQGILAETLTPKVTYEIDAAQAAVEGVDIHGVSLGDAVQVVDKTFGDDGLRLAARVTAMTVDELNEREITVTLGNASESIASQFKSLTSQVASMSNTLTTMSTAEYIDNLLARINAEINATGGYAYIVPGNGILTFDVAVADPLNPTEASQVVEIKGGTIRIANSKTAQGAWEWKTVFTSGHLAADVVTAANIRTGFIGDAFANYWNLDTGLLHTVEGQIGGFTITGSSLYNGLSTIGGSTSGTYIGNDGIATAGETASEKVLRMQLDGGSLTGYQNGTLAGTISPNAMITVGSENDEVGGTVIAGDALLLTTPYLAVATDGDPDSDAGVIALQSFGRNYCQLNNVNYDQSTSLKFTPRRVWEHVTNGIKDTSAVYDYSTIPSSHVVELPTKTYVDAQIPSFSLSGNNLFITL